MLNLTLLDYEKFKTKTRAKRVRFINTESRFVKLHLPWEGKKEIWRREILIAR